LKSKDANKISNNVVESLFEGEDIPPIESTSGLAELKLKPSEEVLKSQQQASIEKRQFTRIENANAELSLNFSNELHFARQYIQNISVGGLFVKTNLKRELGAILPLDFEVPVKGKRKRFQLNARVCRQTTEGLGLQFVDLASDVRAELEEFIQEILPPGEQIQTASYREASKQRLEQTREAQRDGQTKFKKTSISILILFSLIALNTYLLLQPNEDGPVGKKISEGQSFQFAGKQIKPSQVRAFKQVRKSKVNSIVITLADGSSLSVPELEFKANELPEHLSKSYEHLRSIPKQKRKHRSGSAPRIVKKIKAK